MSKTEPSMNSDILSKVPAVTFAFWLLKICATTQGETGGDALSMNLDLGYVTSTAIFFAVFLGTMLAQVRADTYHPFLYWGVIVATTLSNYLRRTAGPGYVDASALMFAMLIGVLGLWYAVLDSVSASRITSSLILVAVVFVAILFIYRKSGQSSRSA